MQNKIFDIQRFADISNIAKNDTVVVGTADADSIFNQGLRVTINALDGNDTINNNLGNNVSISGGAGDDSIYSLSNKVTISGGEGNDSVVFSYITNFSRQDPNSHYYQYSSGNDIIEGFNEQDTLHIDGNYTTEIIGNDFVVKVGNGSVTLKDGKYTKFYIADSAGNLIQTNWDWTLMAGTAGDDTLKNNDYGKIKIEGYEGNDYICNYSDSVTINGGDGNDSIHNGYYNAGVFDSQSKFVHYVEIYTGSGDDIVLSYGKSITIDGGSGDDHISNISEYHTSGNGASYYYAYHSYSSNILMIGGEGNDTVDSYGGDNITIDGGAGDDILIGGTYTNKVDSVDVDGVGVIELFRTSDDFETALDVFVYNSGNDTIQNYQSGEIVSFKATYTGWTNEGNDLILNAAEGSVRINDAKNKLVEVADANGNVLAHVYLANDYEGMIDGRGYGAYEVIVGSDNVNNQIFADTSGSSLWGGRGNSNDELYGNLGVDEYVYSYGNGQDNIFQSGNEDTVNLMNISLDQITNAGITDNGVNLNFADGGALNINGQIGTFIVSGQRYGADYQTKTWYAK